MYVEYVYERKINIKNEYNINIEIDVENLKTN